MDEKPKIQYYYEMGCKWKVEVLRESKETHSRTAGTRYDLKFLGTVYQNEDLSAPTEGLEFSVWKADDFGGAYGSWRLSNE